jgi:hypothetical protein
MDYDVIFSLELWKLKYDINMDYDVIFSLELWKLKYQ